MSRVLPYPVFSLLLLAVWLLLQQSASVGNLILGAVIAVLAGLAMGALKPEKTRFKNPWRIPRLLGIVAYDIVRSNIAVATIIVRRGRNLRSSGFLAIPLTMRSRTGLAFLAIIITATPGTVWLEYDPDSGNLLIHVLDLVDEQHWVDIIKNRYESLLLEILE